LHTGAATIVSLRGINWSRC